jgi:glucose-1-phosphate adenylyltransferase
LTAAATTTSSCVLADTPREIKEEQAAAAARRDFPLTWTRAKPAVPVGGCYKLIDIPMSNCINRKPCR